MKTIHENFNLLEKFISDNFEEQLGYNYGYFEKVVKEFSQYIDVYEKFLSYGATFTTNTEEYALTVFFEDLENFSAILFIVVEDGQGNFENIERRDYKYENDLLYDLTQIFRESQR